MKLEKAINTLSAMQEDYEGDEFPDQEAALKLGGEALKRHQENRAPGRQDEYYLLRGETED